MCIEKKTEKRTISEVNSAMAIYQKNKGIGDKWTFAEKGFLRIFGSVSINGYDHLSRKGNSNRNKKVVIISNKKNVLTQSRKDYIR